MRIHVTLALCLSFLALSGRAEAGPSLLPETSRLKLDLAQVQPEAQTAPPAYAPSSSVFEFSAGAGAALVSVPAALALGSFLGTLSSDLVWAALPAAGVFIALPALAVTFAEAWIDARLTGRPFRLGPSIWVALLTQAAVLGVAIAGNVHGLNLGDAALLTVVNALVLPGTVTLTRALTRPVPTPAGGLQARRPLLDPASSLARRTVTVAVPVAGWSF